MDVALVRELVLRAVERALAHEAEHGPPPGYDPILPRSPVDEDPDPV